MLDNPADQPGESADVGDVQVDLGWAGEGDLPGERSEAAAQVHGKFFSLIRPAATMVVVAALLNPSWKVEIEADAFIPE